MDSAMGEGAMDVSKEERRKMLQATCDDTASKLLYYDRKEDEDLPRGAIEEMVSKGEVTIAEIIEWISDPIRKHLTQATGRKS